MKKFVIAAFALILSAGAVMAQTTPFALCTGKNEGNYYKAGNIMAKYVTNISVLRTEGSVDNLNRIMKGECQGGFVQSDALKSYQDSNAESISKVKRVGPLYNEYVHLLVNKKLGIESIKDLKDGMRVAVGVDGSGSAITWQTFVASSKAGWFHGKKYDKIIPVFANDYGELMAANDGHDIQAVLWVSSFGSSYIKKDAAEFENLVLVDTADKDFKDVKDASGEPIYNFAEIPSGTYPKSLPSGSLWGTKAVETIGIQAVFVVSSKWAADNRDAYNRLLRGYNGARQEIKAIVGQK